MLSVAQYTMPIYAVLMLLGGIMGFVKGKSKASLIAGVVSGVVMIGCFMLFTQDAHTALIAAIVVTGALDAVFAVRLSKTKKFMPSGILLIITAICQIIFIAALFPTWTP